MADTEISSYWAPEPQGSPRPSMPRGRAHPLCWMEFSLGANSPQRPRSEQLPRRHHGAALMEDAGAGGPFRYRIPAYPPIGF
jgi:hypothetical protein